MDEEVYSKKKLDQKKKDLQNQLRSREIHVNAAGGSERLNEEWQQELQDIEQRRNDLLPEHQQI